MRLPANGSMRVLVDENLTGLLSQLLSDAGHDVLDVATSTWRTASDEQLSRLAIEESRIIITRDLGFSLRSEVRPPGLVLLRFPRDYWRPQIVARMGELMMSEEFKRLD